MHINYHKPSETSTYLCAPEFQDVLWYFLGSAQSGPALAAAWPDEPDKKTKDSHSTFCGWVIPKWGEYWCTQYLNSRAFKRSVRHSESVYRHFRRTHSFQCIARKTSANSEEIVGIHQGDPWPAGLLATDHESLPFREHSMGNRARVWCAQELGARNCQSPWSAIGCLCLQKMCEIRKTNILHPLSIVGRRIWDTKISSNKSI